MSDSFKAINPTNKQKISEYPYMSNDTLKQLVERSWKAFEKQRYVDYKQRATKLRKLGDLLDERVNELAKITTDEMGKPFSTAKAEIKKCAKHCRFYADKADDFLSPKEVHTEAKRSYVRFDPIGPVYQIIPFNFPFWLSLKSAVPILLVGNTILHRNAKTVPDAGLALEKLMIDAGFDEDEFLNVFTNHDQTNDLLKNPKIRGVTFTGSTKAGKMIAEAAGENLKKCVMELGGSDAVVVLDDADLDLAAEVVLQSRLRNGGQTCTAGKRFIIDEKIYDEFMPKLVKKVKEYKTGNPYEEDTKLGPMSGESTVKKLEDQVERGLKQGGKVVLEGGCTKEENLTEGYYYKPYIIEVEEGNCLLEEETFGPIFAVIKAKGEQHALKLANESEYGLGGVVIGEDRTRAEKFASLMEAGTVMINKSVDSDSRLPSGGMKASGFGRECGEWGIYEFANIKTVWVE